MVEPFTDEPDQRFAPGVRLLTDTGELEVAAARWHSGRLMVHFSGVDDRGSAEALRGQQLQIDVDPAARPADPDEFYDHQLVGLRAVLVDGSVVGEVTEVLHLPAQDLLSIRTPDARDVLVPFVNAIVPEVDLVTGRLVLTPPLGLLDPAAAQSSGEQDA